MPSSKQIPFVEFVAPSGQVGRLFPGGIIGRLVTAELQIADPQISEAHALVSLRGGALKLLPLRGTIGVAGRTLDELVLVAGQRIQLTDSVSIEVRCVELPQQLLVLFGAGGRPIELSALIYSISLEPGSADRLRIQAAYDKAALAHIWHNGEHMCLQIGLEEPQELTVGVRWTLCGHDLYVAALPRGGAANSTAPDPRARSVAPIQLVARYHTVHVHRRGYEPCVLTGKAAQIVSELVMFGCKPTSWEVIAREVWGEIERESLRAVWDRALARLRRHLRSAGVRETLVRPDGLGNIELVMLPGDEVVDECD